MNSEPKARGIIPPTTKSVLEAVFATEIGRESFALAGGTALAEFYFGHRVSLDLDIFTTSNESIVPFGDELLEVIPRHSPGATVEIERRSPTFRRLLVSTPDQPSLPIDLGAADPPLFDPISRVDGVNVFGLEDLAVGKLMAVSDRTEIRDGVDLWMLNEAGVNLEATREHMLFKDPGLATAPLLLVESLDRLARFTPVGPWPRMLVELDTETLVDFLSALCERFLVQIRASIPGDM